MRKILSLSINTIMVIISSLFAGCSAQTEHNDFQPKAYEEYYNSFVNTTLEIELIIEDKRATCFYTNDSNYFVYTIKYQQSNEFGYIYDKTNNLLYEIENYKISLSSKENLDSFLSNLFKTSNFLFHIGFDYSKFEYKSTVTVCNRSCDKYRFTDQIKDQEAIFNIYIDQETGFCLKAVCSFGDSTDVYFETKKFVKDSQVNKYIYLLNKFNSKTPE